MKRNSEHGVALVVTLIMLSLVTFMAVVFLAVSRRERASVAVTGDIAHARLMTDAALARAQSEIAARMLASTNPFDYDLIVSTNYYNPAGFEPGNTNAYNVNYSYRSGGAVMNASPAQRVHWAQNIANLQFDARPPVFLATNLTGLRTNEFRFYLDLNRNGLFEDTGIVADRAPGGRLLGSNYFTGDPQWIGVLERPDRPHSESNRFVGRYAFVVLPAGKSLDLNFIHNAAKPGARNDLSADGFMRHQGVGSWELNLAGFLAGLNTNVNGWGGNLSYTYDPRVGFYNSGAAFDDARRILGHRYEGDRTKLASAAALFNIQGLNHPFVTNRIDYYSDGPLTSFQPDPVNSPWSGSHNPNGYYDIQELFNTNKTSLAFVQRLTNRSSTVSTYDRYTFYRLLSQMGCDSSPSESNKVYFADYQPHYTNRLHLNYQNFVPNGQTNFISWERDDPNFRGRVSFFTNAADRLLRAGLDPVVLTNGLFRQTNFMLGLTPVRSTFCCTNIQLFHRDAGLAVNLPFYVTNNEYSSDTHRLLQLAANIHDASTVRNLGTTNDYPSVFRPIFLKTITNLTIRGFVEETNTLFLNYPWMTMEQAMAGNTFPIGVPVQGINLYGVPLVIGAKKGYPNFNKFVIQSIAEVSRRLEIRKASPLGPPTQTNQMYVIGISNRFGVEGWNSYQTAFNRNLELRVTNQVIFALSNRLEGANFPLLLTNQAWAFGNSMTINSWPGWTNLTAPSSFVVPVDTNITTLPSSIYLAGSGRLLGINTNFFESSFRVPQWFLRLTNRLQYILIDNSVTPPRVIDFVNLDKLVTEIDFSQALGGNTNAGGGGIFSDKKQTGGQPGQVAGVNEADMWNPQRTGAGLDSPAMGTLNQISVSMGTPYLGEGTWRSSSGQLAEKLAAIKQFTEFMNGRTTNLTWQVPFTPSRRLYQRMSWEANDPLVHYTAQDLAEPIVPGSSNLMVRSIPFDFPILNDAMLSDLNPRYRPWGGNPRKSADATAYAWTMKDPLVRRSDDWQFPTNKFANLGTLGRVHRGTPWQTMYLKPAIDPRRGQAVDLRSWMSWSGSYGTHPTNDWKLLDLFTVAPNENASRGLLSVNQTNLAAWSAVLSGVSVLTNDLPDGAVGPTRPPHYTEMLIQPNSPQMLSILGGINQARLQQTNRVYRTIGEVLTAPELTVLSPFLNLQGRQTDQGIDDAAYERIPQQILSLLRTDEPRIVVYAFGQSLRPAERSLVTVANVQNPIFNLCTNYQVSGEFAAKTVLRLEDLPPTPISPAPGAAVALRKRAVVESYTVLQPD